MDIEQPVTQEEIDAVKNAPEEVVEEKPVEAEAEKPEEGEKPEKPPKDFVPHKAFHAEREQRKALQARLAQVEQENAQRAQLMEQRLQQIQQAAWQAQQPKPPSFDEDPIGAMRNGVESTQAELAQLKAWHQQQAQIQEQTAYRQNYLAQIENAVSQAESEFVQETPDYLDAVGHLKAQRASQLKALGMPLDQIVNYIRNEAFQIAETALRSGRNPAEIAFEMAKASGWVKKAQAQDTKMQTLQKGVKAASSLGSGGAPQGNLTIEALASMSESEFDAALKSGAWEKLGLG